MFMQLNYGVLRKFAVIPILWGVCCLLCVGAAEDDLNRKAGELFTIAIQTEQQGKNTDAEKAYEDCVRFAKENNLPKLEASSLHRLAILKAKEHKFLESEKLFREAINRNNDDATLLCDFAKLFSDQKKYAEAETILKNAVLIAPNNLRVLFNLGSVIALQNDRQTEGLRYLKLAIGETAAYRELARIYRQSGNEGQAEFAEQRAIILEKAQPKPSPDLPATPTMMDAQTQKELVDHVKEELLRLETSEIAEVQKSLPPQARSTDPLLPKNPPLQSLTTVTEQTADSKTAAITKPMVSQPPFDPFLVTEQPQTENSTENSKVEIQEIVPEKEAPKVLVAAPLANDPFLEPVTVKKDDLSFTEISTKSDAVEPSRIIEQPPIFVPTIPKPGGVKIIKQQPTLNEPVKTLPKFARDQRKAKDIRTLPSTDSRISNSTEGEWEQSSQTDLPALTIIPLETPSTNKNIPAYTEIHKIPAEENIRSRFQTAATKQPTLDGTASDFQTSEVTALNLSTEKMPTDENLNEARRPNLLEQPISLTTLESRRSVTSQLNAPIPSKGSSEKSVGYRKIGEQKIEFSSNPQTQNKQTTEDQNGHSVSASTNLRSLDSIWHSGAGKIGNHGGPDSYVYVDNQPVKENPNESESVKVNSTPKPASKIASNSSTKPTTPTTDLGAFSLMKPIPDKLTHQDTPSISPIFPQIPSVETISPPKEIAADFPTPSPWNNIILNEQNVSATNIEPRHNAFSPTMSVDKKAEISIQDDKRSDVQFSSLQTPTVLKFEIASTEKPGKPADLRDRSTPSSPQSNIDVFQPPTVLKFGPAQSEVITKSEPTPSSNKSLETVVDPLPKTIPAPQINDPKVSVKTDSKIARSINTIPSIPEKPNFPLVATAPSNPVLKSPQEEPEELISKQNSELKTEIASETTPQITPQTPGNLESFLAKQSESVQIKEATTPSFPEPMVTDSPVLVKIANETATTQITEQFTKPQPILEPVAESFTHPITATFTKPTIESFDKPFVVSAPVTEQPDQQSEILARSESPKFTVPNRPEQPAPQQPKLEPQPELPLEVVHKVEPELIAEPKTKFAASPMVQPLRNPSPPIQDEVVIKPTETPENIQTPIEIASTQPESIPNLTVISPTPTSEPILKALEQAQKPVTRPRLKPEFDAAERVALNSLPKKLSSNQPMVSEIIEDDEIGFAMTRKNRPATTSLHVDTAVNEFLKPQESFSENPIFSLEEDDENVGFARSGQYSKK